MFPYPLPLPGTVLVAQVDVDERHVRPELRHESNRRSAVDATLRVRIPRPAVANATRCRVERNIIAEP
jgi:hypothetical protein